MGRSWIPWTKGLEMRAEVGQISGLSGLDRFSVAGRLMAVWAWADGETQTGRMARPLLGMIDAIASHEGFADLMAKVGWLRIEKSSFAFPRFTRWMTEPEKQRLLKNERKRKSRESKSAPPCAPDAPLDEPRNTGTETYYKKDTPTESLSSSPPDPNEPPKEPEATEDGKSNKTRKQNFVWNALCEIYGYPDHRPPESKLSRWGKIVRDLQGLNPPADPDEMRRLHRAMVDAWDGREVSPEKFADWLPRFRAKEVEAASKPRLEDASAEDRAAEIERQAKELFG